MKPIEDLSTFDRMRRFAAAEMSSEERARFEAELERDPDLARLAADFELVWSATAGALLPPFESRTRFEEIIARVGPEESRLHRWRRRAAAAAVVLAAATMAWSVWRRTVVPAETVVELHAIPWPGNTSTPARPASVPAVLANWSPVQDGQIRWLESLDEARAVSAAVSRPVFVYGYVEECPICQGFQRNEFQDPKIQALVEQAVPVRIDLMKLEQEEMQVLYARRYPLLEMQNERGEILHTFPGTFADVDMRAELARAVSGLAGLNWRLVHDLATAFVNASSAEEHGRLGEASSAFEKLASTQELPQFAAAGRAGISRLSTAVRGLLETARAESTRDSRAALDRFSSAVDRFDGTPYAADLRAVLDAWSANGKFPTLSVHP
jgi:hypothetical protein